MTLTASTVAVVATAVAVGTVGYSGGVGTHEETVWRVV
jgi:hypothetical protein